MIIQAWRLKKTINVRRLQCEYSVSVIDPVDEIFLIL